mmetsp:Transcript_58577/g.126764  ORF Transcript_58577/g.126764 Transcript_58577/m.126764 type:complete len:99 (+) Transcript_58577:223-519(+)
MTRGCNQTVQEENYTPAYAHDCFASPACCISTASKRMSCISPHSLRHVELRNRTLLSIKMAKDTVAKGTRLWKERKGMTTANQIKEQLPYIAKAEAIV